MEGLQLVPRSHYVPSWFAAGGVFFSSAIEPIFYYFIQINWSELI